MCIAHQLKQAGYKKMIDLMRQDAFEALNQMFYLVVVGNRTFDSLVGNDLNVIKEEYRSLIASIPLAGEQLIRRLEEQLKSGWGWYSYMPPESRGATIGSIARALHQPQFAGNRELRNLAAFSVEELVATTQSTRHLDNTLDRITIAMGTSLDRKQGVQLINSIVSGTPYASCIDRCETRLANAEPLMGRAFLRNDEPDFQLARFPLHHPAHSAA